MVVIGPSGCGKTTLLHLYDRKTGTLTEVFCDVPVAESDEDKPRMILDYDAIGNIVSVEVLGASKRVEEPRKATVGTEG